MINISESSLYGASLPPLSKKEELELAQQAATGNKKAREILIRANIRYALSYAKKFYGYELSKEDVDEEAVIGLIKGVDRFDYTRGTKIITFAKMYIMNEIMTACNKSGYVQHCISLDNSKDSENNCSLLASIPDTKACQPEEASIYHIQKEALYKNFKSLTPREKEILCMFYGLNNYKEPYSLSEIGKMFNVSKQCIYYIKEGALNKLRANLDAA